MVLLLLLSSPASVSLSTNSAQIVMIAATLSGCTISLLHRQAVGVVVHAVNAIDWLIHIQVMLSTAANKCDTLLQEVHTEIL
jgi:hypothetical protein